jgi:hypothetical protein
MHPLEHIIYLKKNVEKKLVFQLEKLTYLILIFLFMNDNYSYLELILTNDNISYIIDIYQENTIKSQETVLNIVDDYRKKLKESNNLKLILRRISEENGDLIENTIDIKSSRVFQIKDVTDDLNKEFINQRKIKLINSINFKI